MIIVTIRPAHVYPGTTIAKPGARGVMWDVLHDGVLTLSSLYPFNAACRYFLAQGHPPDTPLEMYHDGEIHPALHGTLGPCAARQLSETDKGLRHSKFREVNWEEVKASK